MIYSKLGFDCGINPTWIDAEEFTPKRIDKESELSMDLRGLIEAAAKRAGSQTALAKELGVHTNRVTDWKIGTRPCPVEVQARIAQLAGEDAQAWVWEVVRAKLGKMAKSTALGALVMLGCGSTVAALSAAGAGIEPLRCATMYIM